jgi:hypothetical protein
MVLQQGSAAAAAAVALFVTSFFFCMYHLKSSGVHNQPLKLLLPLSHWERRPTSTTTQVTWLTASSTSYSGYHMIRT